ncbi:MAG TPA: chemotaxis protein CheD [Bryobacteraceae bacterium]|nr:chemotaxis protein CheD [Bryobacteraceae bacterium]
MNHLTVGISDCKVSSDPDSVLVTYALGSCIAVAVHDPVTLVAGLLHYLLPEASLDREKAAQNPYMFADTGISRLLKDVCQRGAQRSRLVVRIAGGARMMNSDQLFQIGKRNHLAARKLLWKAGLLVKSEAVGGEVSRTVRLETATGRVLVRESGLECGGHRETRPAERSLA